MSDSFTWPVRVYYEDTDAGGVVFYANYLKFMERARTEWLRSFGYEQDQLMQEEGILFAVAAVDIRYRRPARFNDRLSVSCRVSDSGRTRISFEQTVVREDDGELMATATVTAASLDADSFRPRPMPAHMAEKLLNE